MNLEKEANVPPPLGTKVVGTEENDVCIVEEEAAILNVDNTGRLSVSVGEEN